MRASDVTIRKAVLNECHRLCDEVGIQFFMTGHFIEKINLRSPDQDQAFTAFIRAIRFMLERREEFSKPLDNGRTPVICLLIFNEYFLMKIDKQLTCMTYFTNDTRPITAVTADRKFQLKLKEEHAV